MGYRVSRIISDETLSRIIQIESAGNPQACARTSSALGLGQFIEPTWLAVVCRHRLDWAENVSQGELLAMRLDPVASIEMLARHTEDNARALGSGYTDGDIYLAHFSGVDVARQLLHAPVKYLVSRYYSAQAVAANRNILEGKTVGQVRAWAGDKMKNAGVYDWISEFWPPEKYIDDGGLELSGDRDRAEPT